MVELKVKREIIYLGILVFSLIGGVTIIQSCAKETRIDEQQGGNTLTDISSLPQSEQAEVIQLQDSLLGEAGLISDTELNPAIIEASLEEFNILTARAPILPKYEADDEEAEVKQEIDKELSINQIIKNFTSVEIAQKFEIIEQRFKDADRLGEKYSSLLRKMVSASWILSCKTQNKLQSSCLATQMSNCEIKILGCDLDDYSVSGTINVSLNGSLQENNYSFFSQRIQC